MRLFARNPRRDSLVACQPPLTQPWEQGSVVCHGGAFTNKTSLCCSGHLSHKEGRTGCWRVVSNRVRFVLNAPQCLKKLWGQSHLYDVSCTNWSPHYLFSRLLHFLCDSNRKWPWECETLNQKFFMVTLHILCQPYSTAFVMLGKIAVKRKPVCSQAVIRHVKWIINQTKSTLFFLPQPMRCAAAVVSYTWPMHELLMHCFHNLLTLNTEQWTVEVITSVSCS